MFKVPEFSVTPPVKSLFWLSVTAPVKVESRVRLLEVPENTPVWIRLPLPLTVMPLPAPVIAATDSVVVVLAATGLRILRIALPVSVTAPVVNCAVPLATFAPPWTVN
ncbi:MAG: hypothetical protein WCO97_07590 [bacterium]